MPFTTRALRRNVLSVLVHSSLLSFFTASPASAATVTSLADDGPGSLRAAINSAASGDTIGFDCAALSCPATITLTSQGNNQGFPGPTAFSIKGKSLTISGPNPGDITLQAQPGTTSATSLRLFFVDTSAALELQNLTLTGGKAIGGKGGDSQNAPQAGNGGGGAGLGGAIFSQGALTLAGVSFTGNSAAGGKGGVSDPNSAFGGGGGMGGDGGSKAGGGGGTGGDGGSQFSFYDGALLTHCGGHGGQGLGGVGGGTAGCESAQAFSVGGLGSNGGGGGGGFDRNGGSGSDGGGGGAGTGPGAYAGAGGFGGGGGGGRGLHAGLSNFGYGGVGGFGGGGGSCLAGHGGAGGAGGGGGQTYYNPATGSFGGGGAGFGGAVFARSGSVTVKNSGFFESLADNTASAGIGYRNGAAAGSGLFLMSGVTPIFNVTGISRINDTISDDSPVGLPAGQSYKPGAGGGLFVQKQGTGILVLNGANTYGGVTLVFEGALAGTGQIASNVYLDGAAAISPGDPTVRRGVGTLTIGALNWAAGGGVDVQIGSNQAGSDLLVVDGPLTKNGSGTWYVDFIVGDNPPKPGTKYTLIQSSDASAFTAADFTATFDSSFNSLTGAFSIEDNAVKFTVGTVSTDLIFRNGYD